MKRDILLEYLNENKIYLPQLNWGKEEIEKFSKFFNDKKDYYKRLDRDIKLEQLLMSSNESLNENNNI